jgi:cytochrome c oxidase assembly protein Cox11
MINPQEELLLPLFFYLEPELIEDPQVGKIREIKVNYQFY